MKATLEIQMDNAAFEEDAGWELARILTDLADRIGYANFRHELIIRDINGNKVGELKITE